VTVKDFNTYGSRRGNDEVMARGTFANIRLVNKLLNGETGPRTVHVPSGDQMDVFDAALRYQHAQQPVVILAGKEYGSGSSRDWAAKGPYLQVPFSNVKVSVVYIYQLLFMSGVLKT